VSIKAPLVPLDHADARTHDARELARGVQPKIDEIAGEIARREKEIAKFLAA
jgi:hypothetical protein